MKWGLASAALPAVTDALTPAAEATPLPEIKADRVGSTTAMASLRSGLQVFYREDWLGAPWLDGEPVVFLHGALELSDVWWGWVPRMAQHYRLYRPDLPGFARSKIPANFEWSFANYMKFIVDFLDALGLESAHIVGAKTGGALAMQFAATYPKRVRTLIVCAGPFSSVDRKFDGAPQSLRLGTMASKEEMDYFDRLREATDPVTRREISSLVAAFNLDAMLPKITAPTLIITTDRSALQPVEKVIASQPKIPNSRLLVLTSDAYHVAVAKAGECATNAIAFMEEAKRKV
jgi:pimeloyl-ACP methyl ester carboxylesterase